MKLDAYIIPSVSMNHSDVPMGSTNGFISKRGYKNSSIQIQDKVLRERSELLLLKDNKILVQRHDEWETGDYKIPGGSTDSGLSVIETAIKECQEEALITPMNVRYWGHYCHLFTGKDKVPKWLKNRNQGSFPIDYDGYYTHVCVGLYDKPYKQKIEEEDQDAFCKKAKWILIEEARKFLREEHIKALDWYLFKP